MQKSDILIYFVAVILGICAGLIEVRIGDLLLTSLFVLTSTLVLGFLRPRHAWRWPLVVAPFLPLVELAVHLLLGQRLYRAQVWESGFGFVTGTVGCYAGVLARKGVDELVRTNK
ncbi:MAG TPA: hypothetical protein VFA90_02120 [Terriglobales bacterium]|nr:hypothetical protein [Terriglobales bacterium]